MRSAEAGLSRDFALQNWLMRVVSALAMSAVDEELAVPKWTQSTGEELANTISHGIGLIGAMIGTPILLLAAFHHGSISFLIGTVVFTVTMLVLYLGSLLYHAWPQTPAKSILQVLDHSAIFLLIVCPGSASWSVGLDHAGTYLGIGRLRCIGQGDARHCAPQEICDGSLSGNGLAGSHFYPAACARGSAFRAALASCRWNRLHDRRVVLREQTSALRTFCLASVCPRRHRLSLCGRVCVRCLIYAVRNFQRTISQKRMAVSKGTSSQDRIDGMHQSANNAVSAGRGDEIGTSNPS